MKTKSIFSIFIFVFIMSCIIPTAINSVTPTPTPEGLWLSTEFLKDYSKYPVLPNGIDDIYSGAWAEAASRLNISLKPNVKTTQDWKSESFIQDGSQASGLKFIVPDSSYYTKESTPMSEVPMGEAENFSMIKNFNGTGEDVVVIGARVYNFDGSTVLLPYLVEATGHWNNAKSWKFLASCIGKKIGGSSDPYAERSLLAPVNDFGSAKLDSFDGVIIKDYYIHDNDARNALVDVWLKTGAVPPKAANIPWSPMCSYVR